MVICVLFGAYAIFGLGLSLYMDISTDKYRYGDVSGIPKNSV